MDMTNLCDVGSNLKISGAFEGLTNILLENPYIYKEDDDICFRLYRIVKKYTDYNVMKEKNRKNDCRGETFIRMCNYHYLIYFCIVFCRYV